MTIWFTSDTHFGHKNILKYCPESRGHFKNIQEHDETIIQNWNENIQNGDDVYHLGDFSFAPEARTRELLSILNGNIHLIRGNHDKAIRGSIIKEFAWVKDYYRLKWHKPDGERQDIILFHYPIASWDKAHHGSWHLHGHCHGTFHSESYQARLDAGVDVHNMTPVSIDQIAEHMSTKEFKPVDHHGTRTESGSEQT